MRRNSQLALSLLLALDLALRLFVAFRPLDRLDGVTIPDDAYLSLHLARSLARGEGPFYEVGHTNGFQPLYVYLAAPLMWVVGGDPVAGARAALVLLAACDALALALLWRRVGRDTRSLFARTAVALAWIFSPYAAQTAANGLETTLAFATLVLLFDTLRAIERSPAGPPRGGRLFGLGAALGLAALARFDALIALPVIAVRVARRMRGERATAIGRALAFIALGALIAGSPWVFESLRWTRSLLPVSAAAVHSLSVSDVTGALPPFSHFATMAIRAGNTIVRKHLVLYAALLVPLSAAFVFLPRDARRRFFERFGAAGAEASFAVLLVATYVFLVFGSWYFQRYFFPVTLPLMLALGLGVGGMAEALAGVPAAAAARTRWPGWKASLARDRALAVAGALTIVAAGVAQPGFRKCFASSREQSRHLGYMNAGLWARARLAAGTRVGAHQSGAIGYFADSLVVVNLDGVVNARALSAFLQRRELEYIRSERVEWVLGWRGDLDFIRDHSRGWREGDIEPVERARGFTSWNEPWFLYRVRPAGAFEP